MPQIERFKLAHSCRLDNDEIAQAGTPVKILQNFGPKVLIEIPAKDYVQKFIALEDLEFLDTPMCMWGYNIDYNLDGIDIEQEDEVSSCFDESGEMD